MASFYTTQGTREIYSYHREQHLGLVKLQLLDHYHLSQQVDELVVMVPLLYAYLAKAIG